MKYFKYLFILFSILGGSSINAQDLHFSQFMNAPLLTNPANTGFIPNADYRIGANFRQQWATVPVPYKTYSIWGDAQIMRDEIYNGWIGVGGSLLSDVAGRGGLQSTKINAHVAYHQMLGDNSLLSVGFNGGLVVKRVNPLVFSWDNQWNGKFFDANLPVGENFANNVTKYADIGFGLNYAYFPDENRYYNAGLSVNHVNRPKESFFTSTSSGSYDAKVAPRITGFANGSFKLSEKVIINPSAYASFQGKASEIVAGATAIYNLKTDYQDNTELFAGLYYRYKDAVVPTVGLLYKNMRFTISYDVTTSNNLARFNSLRGGNELSLIRQGFYNNTSKDARKVGCFMPSF
jgi:type IX secretion system PorP/SprF family membrane protein